MAARGVIIEMQAGRPGSTSSSCFLVNAKAFLATSPDAGSLPSQPRGLKPHFQLWLKDFTVILDFTARASGDCDLRSFLVLQSILTQASPAGQPGTLAAQTRRLQQQH